MTEHFHPLGKGAFAATKSIQAGLRASLPSVDTRDLDEAKRGFIASPDYRQIMAHAGHVAWDMGAYDFLLGMEYGLFEVLPGVINQVRGFDLVNISFVKSDTGWIVFDPGLHDAPYPRARDPTYG